MVIDFIQYRHFLIDEFMIVIDFIQWHHFRKYWNWYKFYLIIINSAKINLIILYDFPIMTKINYFEIIIFIHHLC